MRKVEVNDFRLEIVRIVALEFPQFPNDPWNFNSSIIDNSNQFDVLQVSNYDLVCNTRKILSCVSL